MDTSKEYIEMCEKAVIYLGIPKSFKTPFIDKKKWQILECPYYKDCIPLYTQDQLQEIVVKECGIQSVWGLLTEGVKFWEKLCENNQHPEIDSNSMEQLWLAFIMHERFDKKWNGKDWVKDGEDSGKVAVGA